MLYPYKVEISDDGKTYRGTVVDFGAYVEAPSLDELTTLLDQAFTAMVETVRRKKVKIPLPSTPFEGCGLLYVPMQLQLRILLINLMRDQKINGSELAKILGVSRQRAQDYVNASGNVSVEKYEAVLQKLGAYPCATLNLEAFGSK